VTAKRRLVVSCPYHREDAVSELCLMTLSQLHDSHSALHVTVAAMLSGAKPVPRHNLQFLGAFANLRKATVSFIMSVCPSVHLRGSTRFPPDRCS